jgi:hypothetical protein
MPFGIYEERGSGGKGKVTKNRVRRDWELKAQNSALDRNRNGMRTVSRA